MGPTTARLALALLITTLPLDSAPAALSDAALATGAFDAITEVSTVWPRQRAATGGPGDWAIPMLRELAARYRTD